MTDNWAVGGAGAAGVECYSGGGGGGPGLGGGIFNNAGQVALVNVTLSRNRAVGGAGGAVGMNGPCANSDGDAGNGGGAGGAGGTGGWYTLDGHPGGFGGGGGGGKTVCWGCEDGLQAGGVGGVGGFGGGGGGASEHAGTIRAAGGYAGGMGSTGGGGGGGAGGGLFNREGEVVIVNTTIADNMVMGGTGGYSWIREPAEGGQAVGGGVFDLGGRVVMTNTIVMSNAGGVMADCGALGGTIFGRSTLVHPSGGCPIGPTDIVTTQAGLGELGDNGGPSQTHALLEGSPARDAGEDAACPRTDQRGYRQPAGSHCDIGAYEGDAWPHWRYLLLVRRQ